MRKAKGAMVNQTSSSSITLNQRPQETLIDLSWSQEALSKNRHLPLISAALAEGFRSELKVAKNVCTNIAALDPFHVDTHFIIGLS